MTSEYTAMIPDMTTGIRHCGVSDGVARCKEAASR